MDDLLTAFAKQLVTVGPVGLFVLLAIWIVRDPFFDWLRNRQAQREAEPSPKASAWHIENRDTLRETNERTERMETMESEHHDEELKVLREIDQALRDIASQQARLADVLQAFMLKRAVPARAPDPRRR